MVSFAVEERHYGKVAASGCGCACACFCGETCQMGQKDGCNSAKESLTWTLMR
jgi:hypothetical protein